jgi:peptidyl-prolyl cis-trans isomerase C
MHQSLRTGLLAILALACTQVANAQAPAAAPGGTVAPQLNPALLKEVVATVNGDPITRGEVINFLSRVPVPPGDEKDTYRYAIELLANNLLIKQFLTKSRIVVTDAELNAKISEIEKRLEATENRKLSVALAEASTSIAEFKDKLAPQIGWEKYVNAVATDTNLKKFADDNKDLFSRTQVKASHILLLIAENAPAATKDAIKARLVELKKQIEAGTMTFADAANKFSEDDANKTSPNGGDLGYFVRKGQFIEKFAAAAFAMQKGQISDPVETEYGLHLIQVTDRKAGQTFDPIANRALVLNQYRSDLEERVVNSGRKTAKIDVKPMPADFFPKAAPAAVAPASGATTKGATTPPASK